MWLLGLTTPDSDFNATHIQESLSGNTYNESYHGAIPLGFICEDGKGRLPEVMAAGSVLLLLFIVTCTILEPHKAMSMTPKANPAALHFSIFHNMTHIFELQHSLRIEIMFILSLQRPT